MPRTRRAHQSDVNDTHLRHTRLSLFAAQTEPFSPITLVLANGRTADLAGKDRGLSQLGDRHIKGELCDDSRATPIRH
jgi:hypothetical protein